jgi:cytochrome c biogenesis protein CcdA
MVHAVIVVLLLGLGDSLNPTTVGPAMYLATVDHPRRRLAEFLVGFLAVNVAGGLLIMFGPGQLLLDVLPKPKPLTKHIIEIVAGTILIAIAVGLWTGRRTLGRRTPPTFAGSSARA